MIKILIIFTIILNYVSLQDSIAATVTIGDNQEIFSSTILINDNVNFTGNGTLNLSVTKNINSISTNTDGVGTIKVTTAGSLEVENSIGSSSNKIDKINFEENGFVSFAGDLYVKNGISTNSNDQGNILLKDAGGGGGGGAIIVSANPKIVCGPIGSSSNKLYSLEIRHNHGVRFDSDIYITRFTNSNSSGTPSISGNGAINADISTFSGTAKLNSLSSNINLGTTTINTSKELTLSNTNFVQTSSLTINSSASVIVDNDSNLYISGNVNGSGQIIGDTTGNGNIHFNGTSNQAIASSVNLGTSSNRLNSLNNSNINILTSNEDIYVTNINFTNNSSQSTIEIASSKEINISGNISQTSGGTSLIKGSGTLNLTGSSTQNINSSIGSSTSDRISTLTIGSSSQAIFNENVYTNTLNLNSSHFSVAGDKVLDTSSAINLSSKRFNSIIGNSNYGQLKSSDTITINNATNIHFDYSGGKILLDTSGATEYVIAQSTNGIIGTIGDVNVTDNSYLFDNILAIKNNNIVTSIARNSEVDENTLGKDNYDLLENALRYSDSAQDLANNSNRSSLLNRLAKLKPSQNASFINSNINMHNNSLHITASRIKTINTNITGFSTGNNNRFGQQKFSHTGLWAEIFHGGSNQGNIKGQNGYSSDYSGLILGADKKLKYNNNHVILGAGIIFGQTNVKEKSNDQNSGEINSNQLTFYNNNAKNNGLGFYNNNSLNIAFNEYLTNRDTGNGTAHGDFEGISYSIKTGIGYNYQFLENFLIAPNFALTYFGSMQDSYTETGAGNNSLHVENDNFTNYSSEIGLNMNSRINIKDYELTPRLDIAWQRNYGDKKQTSNIRFTGGGQIMQNNSINIQKDLLNIGLGTHIFKEESHSLEIKYDLQIGQKYSSHLGAVQFRVNF